MKKRVLSLLSVILVLSFVLVACGSKGTASQLEGSTWKLTGGKDGASGIEITQDQLSALGMQDFTFEFKKDGAVTVSFAGESVDGTYSEKDDAITITADGDSMNATLEDEKLTIEQDGTSLYFEKSK